MFDLPKNRSVLQRHNSVTNIIQAFLDGAAVLLVAYGLIIYNIGALTTDYINLLLLLMLSLAVFYNHYAIYRSNTSLFSKMLSIYKAWSLCFAFLLFTAFLVKQTEIYSRVLVAQLYLIGFAVQVLLHSVMRALGGTIIKRINEPDIAVFVGTGRLANHLYKKILDNPWLHQQVIGCVDIRGNVEAGGYNVEFAASTQPQILGSLQDLEKIIVQKKVRTVYFVTPLDASEVLERLYFMLMDNHVAVHWVPDIFTMRLVNHSVREIAGIPVLTLSETPLIGTRRLIKAIEDYVLALIILLIIAPVLLIVAIAIKLDSPGPVLFKQERMGWKGNIFRIWKFRSMYVHKPKDGVIEQAKRNDPRITRVGAFIRRTSVDELPQIFNVLSGDMSLVGPRPHAIQHDYEYSKRINDYFARHNIKPGITGLAQVRGFRGETKDAHQMERRIESDIEYINNWSLWLDLFILMRTTGAFTGKHAY